MMKFTFPIKYKFSCKKCGRCCNQYSFSLTKKDLSFIKKKLNQKDFKVSKLLGPASSFFPYEVAFNKKYCPFLKENLCSIYNDRFMICRLYPFNIILLQNEEFQVELTRCNGVSLDEGELINEDFIHKLIGEIKNIDPEFIEKYLNYRKLDKHEWVSGFTLFDAVKPTVKLYMRKTLYTLYNNKQLKNIPIEIKSKAILELYYDNYPYIFKEFAHKIGYDKNFISPIYLLNIDIKYLLNNFKNVFKKEILNYVEKEIKFKSNILKQIQSDKKMEIEINKIVEEKKLDDVLEIRFRNGSKQSIKVRDMVIDKKYTSKALMEIDKYFKELLTRLGNTGFPIEIPLENILEALTQQAWYLYVQSKAYSTPKKIINKNDVLEAISYIDRKNIIFEINKKIAHEQKIIIPRT